MGTGIVGDLLLLIPFHARWLYYLSIVFFALNSLLFILAFVTSFIRYTLYPEIWGVMIRDPANSLFLACIPIGFAVLVELWVGICVPVWGPWAVTFAWVCWMIDTIAAVAITVSIPFLMYDLKALPPGQRQLAANVHTRMANKSPIGLERITAAQLLPIAATVVAAGVGGVVADALPNPQHALGTLLTCYVIWGMSMPLALTIIVIYYQRLTLHKLPSREVIVSCFLPLGPLGYGGYGYVLLNTSKPNNALTATKNTLSRPNLHQSLRSDKHAPRSTQSGRPGALRVRLHHGADRLGLRHRLARPRRRHDAEIPAVSLQHGLVGLHVPARRLRGEHDPDWRTAA